jgi:hypothetical protein
MGGSKGTELAAMRAAGLHIPYNDVYDHMDERTGICVYMCVYVCICVCMCVYVSICVYMCIKPNLLFCTYLLNPITQSALLSHTCLPKSKITYHPR